MKHIIFFLLVITASASCGVHIQQRVYRNGFWVSRSGERPETSKHITTSSTVVALVSSDMPACHKSVEQSPLQTAADTTKPAYRPAKYNTAATAVPANKDTVPIPVEEPSSKTVDQQIADLHKLDVATKISLLLWLTIIGCAIGIPAAFVLSLITLIRIKRLKREHPLTEKQMAETEKIRRHARAVLWISSILLALAIIVLITLLASPWSVAVAGPFLSF